VFVYLKALVFCVDGRKVLKLKMRERKKKKKKFCASFSQKKKNFLNQKTQPLGSKAP